MPTTQSQDDYNESFTSSGEIIGPDDVLLVTISSVDIAPFHTNPGQHRKVMLPQHQPPPLDAVPHGRRQFSNPISYLGGPKLDHDQKTRRTRTSIESVLSLD